MYITEYTLVYEEKKRFQGLEEVLVLKRRSFRDLDVRPIRYPDSVELQHVTTGKTLNLTKQQVKSRV